MPTVLITYFLICFVNYAYSKVDTFKADID